MRNKKDKKIFLLFLLLLSVLTSVGQKKRGCDNEVLPAIETSREAESGEKDYADTLKKNIRLIFEKQFNDSIIIRLDNSIIYNSMLTTNRPNAPRAKIIDVDYSMKKRKPRIIIEKSNGECTWFYLKPGYRVAYINYVKDVKIWVVELSNIQRQYI